MRKFPYPKSFPTESEEFFLRLILAPESEFKFLWHKWSTEVVFDDIDSAIVRLLPLLSMRLSKAGEKGNLVQRIHGVYKFTWFKNQQLLQGVQELLEVCQKNNIPVVVLKGIPLLINVYKNSGARVLGDGDILIHPEDVLRFFTIMSSMGWRHKDPSMTNLKKFGLKDLMHATTFVHPKNNIHLEVHWHVYHVDLNLDLFRLILLRPTRSLQSTKYLWQSTVPLTLGTVSSLMLSPEDLFIHIVVHGAEGNNRRPLRWVVDAIWIMKTYALDWDYVFESIYQGNHIFHMLIAVNYLIEKFSVSFPEEFIAKLNNVHVPKYKIRRYYQLANMYYAPLGNFPILWYRYWSYESEGPFLTRLYKFFDYLRIAWNIPYGKSLSAFIYKKYFDRFKRLFISFSN